MTTCLCTNSSSLVPFRHCKTALRSPLSHLFSRLNSTSSQPVLVGEVLQTSDHIHNPVLDLYQQVPILLMLMAPGWKAALQVGSHRSRMERNLPWPTGHVPFDAAQDMFGVLSCKHTLPDHIELLDSPSQSRKTCQSSQGCSPCLFCSACICPWDYPDLCTGPYTWPF